MKVELTKQVLLELAEALPADGYNVLTGLEMHTGWADTIYVTIRSGSSPLGDREDLRARFTAAVASAFGNARHHVQVHWPL